MDVTLISGATCGMVATALSDVTPLDRFSALRRLTGDNVLGRPGEGTVLAAVVVLVVLTILLWWVSDRQRQHAGETTRELFAERAGRRGLTVRERQILLAVVVRSGLGQSHDIFSAVEAFDRGAAKLLAECSQTRTADENKHLETEIAHLRGKLGFQAAHVPGGSSPGQRPSSRDIPVGKIIELTRRSRDGASIQAEVIRNDAVELVVEPSRSIETAAGDFWLARYNFGLSSWEFDTSTVRCDGGRLIVNHSDRVRFVNRRRFPRVAVSLPALVMPLPLMKTLPLPAPEGAEDGADLEPGPAGPDTPAFVRGVVTELAGPGLLINIPTAADIGDRVVVMFEFYGAASRSGPADRPARTRRVVGDLGRVRHTQPAAEGVSVAVELVGLSETDIDELVQLGYAARSRMSERVEDSKQRAPGVEEPVALAIGDRT